MSVETDLQEIKTDLIEIKRLLNELSVKADQTSTLIRPAIDKLDSL